MGRDKALLPWAGGTLLEAACRTAGEAAGQVVLVAPEGRYPRFTGRRIADARPGWGPLAGIEAALRDTDADWNLIVACDMPLLTTGLLGRLLGQAVELEADCLIPEAAGHRHPLAAAYHRRCVGEVSRALDDGVRRVLDAVARVRCAAWQVPLVDQFRFSNANTPGEWEELRRLAGLIPDTKRPESAEARHADKTRDDAV